MYQNHICKKFLRAQACSLRVFKQIYIQQPEILKSTANNICIAYSKKFLSTNKKPFSLESTKLSLSKNNDSLNKFENQRTENKDWDPDFTDLKRNLTILGAVGFSTSLTTLLLGSATYGLTITPLLFLHYETILKHLKDGSKTIISLQKYLQTQFTRLIFTFQDKNVGECFEKVATQNSNEAMILFADTKWTYKQVELLTNKITNHFLSLNYKKGDVVAILMTNRPEYITLILGLANIGIVSALMDTSLNSQALSYALYLSKCRALIMSNDLISKFINIRHQYNYSIELFQIDGDRTRKEFTHLGRVLQETPFQKPEIIHKVHNRDQFMSIFSATNSHLSKIQTLTHSKFIEYSLGVTNLLNLQQNKDLLYNSLPLCHSASIVTSIGPAVICGIPVLLNNRFTPNNYWSECKKYNCTVGQYSNDTCQELLKLPRDFYEKNHKLEKMIGSNVNEDTWKEFIYRFNTEKFPISEYIISENSTCTNVEKNLSALDSMKPIRSLTKRMQYSHSSNKQPATIAPVTQNETRYLEPPKRNLASDAKKECDYSLLQLKLHFPNIVRPATSGNLKYDSKTYMSDITKLEKTITMHLKSKTVHAYQYNGKVVVTKEIEAIFNIILGHPHCLVYGVAVPGIDGKLGMVTIIDSNHLINMQRLSKQILQYIPLFARPAIIRVIHERTNLNSFGTEKMLHAMDGFNPARLKDKLYYYNKSSKYYEPLTEQIYKKIMNNNLKF